MTGVWLHRFAPRPRPRARLFCFAHAGAGASAYRLWPAGLPAGLDVCAIQLPGREGRLREPALKGMADIVDALLPTLSANLDLPFAFFGHSMGAVLASEVAQALAAQGSRMPAHLILSGRRPARLEGTGPDLHPLPDAEFAAAINQRYGGIPAELLEHADVMALLLPGLRADITALETHRPPQRPPLDVPITVFGGEHDPLTPQHHLDAWRTETRCDVRVRMFQGDHFYLKPRVAEVLAEITAIMAPLLHEDHASTQPLSAAPSRWQGVAAGR